MEGRGLMYTKLCSHCGEEKPLDQFYRRYCGSHRDESGMGYDHRCIPCHNSYNKSLREVKKNAPPMPDVCDCCGKDLPLRIDHIRGTTIVRGWLCKRCNQGIGQLGDNLEGVKLAYDYLNHQNETIN